MPARFNITKHKGTSLTQRSGDFLNYAFKYNGQKYGASGNISRIESLRKDLKLDEQLRPFTRSVALIGFVLFCLTLFSFWHGVLAKKYATPNYRMVDMTYLKEDGFAELNNGNLEQAQCDFMRYQEDDPLDFVNTLGLTMTLVSRCELDYNYCRYAQQYLTFTKQLSLDYDSYIFSANLHDLSSRISDLNY